MQQFFYFFNTYADYITLVMLGLFILALILFSIVIVRLNKVKKQYDVLLRGMENKNLEDIILTNAQTINKMQNQFEENKKLLELIGQDMHTCIKRINLKRYNAFDGVGGEQSFSLALLDENGTGIVISSIHGRDDARTYAKTIINGKSSYHLSDEERIVVQNAINK